MDNIRQFARRIIRPLSLVLLVLFLLPTLQAQQESPFQGSWEGNLQVGAESLALVFNIEPTPAGTWACLLDVPQQGAKGLIASEVNINGPQLLVQYAPLNANYQGQIDSSGQRISGTWSQNGQNFPLQLNRLNEGQSPTSMQRPQTPQAPFPYTSSDEKFINPQADSIRLAGTLTLPPGEGPFPAAILLSGSGPQNRDEEILGHQPFWIIADYLTRKGIAVFRYDDRGVAESEGDFVLATSQDFASDAKAALHHLQQHPKIAAKQIGFIGHSEGGVIAPMIASQQEEVAFMILLAAPGVPLSDVLQKQAALIAKAEGVPTEIIQRDSSFNAQVFKVIRGNSEEAKVEEALLTVLARAYEALLPEEQTAAGSLYEFQSKTIARLRSPWMNFLLNYEPSSALEKVRCPVLALNGDRDLQVEAEQNLPAIEAALELGPCNDFEIKTLAGLNHLFQHSETGKPSEYGKLEESFAEGVLEVMGEWLGARF